MKGDFFHRHLKGCLTAAGLPIIAMIIGWFFGAICAFCFMLLFHGAVPDLGTALGLLSFYLIATPLHPAFWIYCGLSAAWATITNDIEVQLGIVCDFLFLFCLVVLFALSFGVPVLEPNFVQDRAGWAVIVVLSGIIVGLSVLARTTLTHLLNQSS